LKYIKAAEVLPDKLLREIQKYVDGGMLYIPKAENHKQWGESTGSRTYYQRRNEDIKVRFKQGAKIDQLAFEYNLSTETIKKIVYRK
jgi:Mor family transcriptional regulator